jgi:hypothetical protein
LRGENVIGVLRGDGILLTDRSRREIGLTGIRFLRLVGIR